MKSKNYNWMLPILGLFFALLSICAGALGWYFQQLTVSFLFFVGGACWANFSHKKYTLLIIILPFFLLYGYTIVSHQAYNVIPILLSCPISTLIGGYYSYPASLRIKGLIIISTFIFLTQIIFLPNWMVLTLNKPDIEATPSPKFALLNASRDTVWSDSWIRNVVILDFWNTACAACIEKFPELEKVKKSYLHNKNVKVYSINLPLKRDNPQLLDKILEGYTFETLYAFDSDSLRKTLEIEAIPYVIVIDSNGFVRYRGGLYTDWNIFIGNIYDQIEGL